MIKESKTPFRDGFVTQSAYDTLIASTFFKNIEKFSNEFIKKVGKSIQAYNLKWVADPLHQWSRQWEYPYIIDQAKSLKKTAKVIDLGAGMSFLPYYLTQEMGIKNIIAVDYDKMLGNLYNQVNKEMKSNITFRFGDMRNLSDIPTESADFVYSVSVLEHTNAYEDILREIYRILKPGGKLSFTFDISLDGLDDIPPVRAQELIDALERTFGVKSDIDVDESIGGNAALVTSRSVAAKDKKLTPWKYPIINVVRPIIKHKKIGSRYKNLTFCCISITKDY